MFNRMLIVASIMAVALTYPDIPTGVEFTEIYDTSQMSFDHPTWVKGVPGHPDHLLVIERRGQVYNLIKNGDTYEKSLFLEVDANIATHWDGAWAIAFHPEFKTNGLFYYTFKQNINNNRSVIQEWIVDPVDLSSPTKVRDIIEFMTISSKSSGDIVFGPDGFLYSSQGDKTTNTGQDMSDMAGDVIRIDIDNNDPGLEYAIPEDNPWVDDENARPEIYAKGVRVPFSMTVDKLDGTMLLGDVGVGQADEINIIKKGANYGWNNIEGMCDLSDCSEYTDPILVPTRAENRCIILGDVYRNVEDSEFYGVLIYGDWQLGNLFGMRFDAATDEMIEYASITDDMAGQISHIGTDDAGRYFVSMYTEHGTMEERATHIYQLTHPELLEIPPVVSTLPFKANRPLVSYNFIDVNGYEAYSVTGQRINSASKNAKLLFLRDPGTGQVVKKIVFE